eukprot:6492761-Amphidinium_carterae.1
MGVAQAQYMAQRISSPEEEPEPENPAFVAVPCDQSTQSTQTQRLPVSLPTEVFTASALTRNGAIYIVWLLPDSPWGPHYFAGVHFGRQVWSGLRDLLHGGQYLSGRDHLRRTTADPTRSPLRAAITLYLSEAELHGSPAEVQLFLWL